MAKKEKSEDKPKPVAAQRITGPRSPQVVTGFRDRVGRDSEWWGHFQKVAFEVMQKYNYKLVHPTIVEYTTNYTRSLGKDHAIVGENIFTLMDPKGEHISLRPNYEASFMRAYHVLHKNDFEEGIPIDHWYTIGSVFGNNFEPREKMQAYLTAIGNSHPVVDAECTVAAYRFLQALGFENIQVLVNSIGDKQSQTNYKKELTQFYKDRKKEVCEVCKPLVVRNPMQALACERDLCKVLRPEAPQSVDWLTESDKDHFIRVLEYFDELEIPYLLSPELIPYNDYHQKTLTGLQVTTEEGTKYILAHGGRYDGLSPSISDREISAMHMTVDLDMCLTAVRNMGMKIPEARKPQIFLAQLGEDAKKRALALREEMHAAGITTVEHYGQDSLKNQLEEATSLGVKITCILGQKEILDGTILVRDMEGGNQEEIPLDRLEAELKKRLGM